MPQTPTREMRWVAAGGMVLVLGACSTDARAGSDPPDQPGGVASPISSPSAGLARWTALDLSGDGTELLAPGSYGLQANGLRGMPWAIVDVPAGFANLGGWVVLDPEVVRGVGYWTVSGVDRDPCGETLDLIDPGTTVADLAGAFAEQALTDMTPPVPVQVGGHSGVYVELRAPADIDFSACGQGKFETWVSDPGGGRYMQEPGQVDRLWILDVSGNRVVLMATAVPRVTEAQLQELVEITESTRFVEPE